MEYRIGNKYTIIEEGKKKVGEIIAVYEKGYKVKWSDGLITFENMPDPMILSGGVDFN